MFQEIFRDKICLRSRDIGCFEHLLDSTSAQKNNKRNPNRTKFVNSPPRIQTYDSTKGKVYMMYTKQKFCHFVEENVEQVQ